MSSKYHLSNRVCSIDFVKGIAAILIVCLHCFRLDAIDGLIHIIAKLSVPVFFIITGLPQSFHSFAMTIELGILSLRAMRSNPLIFYFSILPPVLRSIQTCSCAILIIGISDLRSEYARTTFGTTLFFFAHLFNATTLFL